MKPSINKLNEAKKAYGIYWESYTKGDLETFASTLDDQFEMIGTSESEICHSKADGIEFLKAQLHEVVGKVEMRNRQIDVIPVDPLILVNEQCDIYVLIDSEWNFYSKIRISTLLRETKEGWKVTQQHGSLPDMRVQKGETLAIEKINKENLELRDAVKRRTAELENKNRELAIEGALERVRAVAMGMKKPEDMLEVCREISDRLQEFGVEKIRNIQTAIIDETIGQYLCYQYFTPYNKTVVEKTEYLKSPVEHGMVKQMLASRDGFFIGGLSGKELETFRSHRKEENHFPDPFLDEATQLDYCFLSIGEAGLGLTLYQPMAEDVLTLFKRFHQVFSLAYQRFRDIQKAEAQTREAQIEAAVERVRAEAMAMHSTEDFGKVAQRLLQQVQSLGIKGFTGATIYLVDESEFITGYDFSAFGGLKDAKHQIFRYDANKFPLMGAYPLKEWKKGTSYFELDFDFEKLQAGAKELEQINLSIANSLKEALASGKLTHQWAACGRLKNGFVAFDMVTPPNEDVRKITIKMSYAFNQAYTRFLDLQKAEAQAREAEIELALERVRARTMAMHYSSELADTATILFQQIKELGFEIWSCGFGIWRPEVDLEEAWMSTGDLFPIILLPYKEDPSHLSIYEASQRGESVFEVEVKGEVLTKHYDWLMAQPSFKIVFGQIENSGIILPTVQFKYAAFFKQGYLHLITTKPQPDIHNINQRFAKVFEQTYTRFLDLQKAEAQAREAEIELALERVRARTMAMHHTEELKEVIQVVFEQFVGLNIHVEHAGFILDYKEQEDMHIWLADHQQGVPTEITIPYFDSPHWNSYLEAKANQESFFTNLLSFEVKNKFYRDLFEWIPELTEEAQQAIFGKPGLAISTVLLDNVGLYIEHYSETPFTSEENAILMRFGKVFQQTYTRFLDLQKAEAQARESQIQLALERVRARTMAMHKSQELAEVAVVLYQELKTLGATQDFFECGYVEVDEIKNIQRAWSTRPDGSFLKEPYYLPLTGEPVIDARYEAWKQRVPVCHQVVGGELLKKANEFVIPFMNNQEAAEISSSSAVPDPVHFYCGNFSNGYLNINCGKPLSAEEESLLARFTGVFEMTYQRFLDLQKAEAQAKDAQIELALERVRAKTMAIQKPDEFLDVISVIGEQLAHLGFDNEWVNFGANGLDISKGIDIWELVIMPGQYQSAQRVFIPYTEHILFRTLIEQFERFKKDGTNFFTLLLDKKELGKWLDHQYKETIYKEMPDEVKALGFSKPSAVSSYIILKDTWFEVGRFSTTHFTEEENEIFKRFANAFGQAYTRFLDLQKAEAQARESQIQLALERVRARTMAMQKSDELPDAANLLFQQVQSLGMPAWSAGYCTWVDDKRTSVTLWMSSEGVLQPPFTAPTTEDELFIEMRKGQEDGKAFHVVEMGGDKLVRHYQYMRTLPVVGEILDSIIEAGHPLPTFQIMHQAYFSKGFLLFITYEPVPQSHDIFVRFAQVFEQTYTRFLDLQKAEAQAREAQIEAALEKVRSRSLAMHSSEELEDVILVVSQQLQHLQFRFENVSFGFDTDQMGLNFWLASPALSRPILMKVPYIDNPAFNNPFQARKEGKDFNVDILTREENQAFLQHMFDHSELGNLPAESKNFLLNTPGFARSQSLMKHTILTVANYALAPYTQEQNEILKRFGVVFDQAYTRFLDLQKAEAQAREAQIEAALERVRSRSMAMHRSEELREVIQLVFEQFRLLNFNIDSAQFDPDYKASDDMNLWTAVPGQPYSTYQHIPYFDNPIFNSIKEAKEKNLSFLVQNFSFEEKNEFFRHFFKYITYVPKERQKLIFESPGFYRAVVFLENIALAIQNYSNIPYTNEEIVVLKRFGKTFEQVYTRFLDLQKAEAQAREAQIEAGLERVRSKSLAMHKTAELQSVIHTVHQELLNLNISISGGSFIVINSEIDNELQCWGSGGTADTSEEVHIPRFEKPFYTNLLERIKTGPGFFTEEYSQDEKIEFFTFLFQHKPWSKLSVEEKKITLSAPGGYTRSCAVSRHTSIFIINHFGEKFSEAENEILKRFGKVFEQAYTRFLDLQKAEAQAREAQIEAALEKVRGRTMAMQSSDELADAAYVLFEQLNFLGVTHERINIGIVNEDNHTIDFWVTEQGGNKLSTKFSGRISEPTTLSKAYHSWKKGAKSLVVDLIGEELKSWLHYLNEEIKIPFNKAYLHSRRVQTAGFFSKGMLILTSPEPLNEEALYLLEKFAGVFDLTYTRFNDLKIAEAQAREAQIEAALERVRSRTVGMQKSDELRDVIQVIYEQFIHLGIDLYGAAFAMDYRESEDWHIWSADLANLSPTLLHIPYFDHPYWNTWNDAKRKGLDTLAYTMAFEEKNSFVSEFGKHIPNLPAEALELVLSTPGYTVSNVFLKNVTLYIDRFTTEPYSVADNAILMRFGKVFEQTYTRFKDLERAEAQARESQIEAALERVRSRTMAMQRSEELPEVAGLLFQQVKALGVPQFHCGFNIFEIDDKECTWYPGSADGDILPPCKIPLTEHPIFMNFIESRKRGDELCIYEKEGEYQAGHYRYMLSLPVLGEILQNMLDAGIPFPTFQIDHLANFSHGNLLFITSEHFPEMHDTFKRFAKVFEQTYTRFLDLQKAEAQAREAQIESSLERVRSRSMAMHKSDELLEAGEILFSEMQKLGIESLTAGFVLMDKEEKNGLNYTPDPSTKKIMSLPVIIPHKETIHMQRVVENWKKGTSHYVVEMDEEETIKHQTFIAERSTNFTLNAEQLIAISPARLFLHNFYFKEGYLLIVGGTRLSAEQIDIMLRFAKVFQQTYTRFLDLQKAEAQAREAQIQLALERVRARTMAMQSSEELAEVSYLLNKQVVDLGIPTRGCAFNIYNEEDSTEWFSNLEGTIPTYKTPRENIFLKYYEAGQRGETLWIEEFGGDQIKEHYKYLATLSVSGNENETIESNLVKVPEYQIDHVAYFKYGYLLFITLVPAPEAHDIFRRFAKEFEQTYTRFLDLQKAEAQAREAQIEVALERVRARAMAMQSSDELIHVANVMRVQMGLLGQSQIETLAIHLYEDDKPIFDSWYAFRPGRQTTGEIITGTAHFKKDSCELLREMIDGYKSENNEYTIEAIGSKLKEWTAVLAQAIPVIADNQDFIEKSYFHFTDFSGGSMVMVSYLPPTDETKSLQKRCTAVFDLAYRRFLDLKQAEAQARESQIQLALERVRARTMAMQHSSELSETSALLFQQIKLLGVPPWSCGFNIWEQGDTVFTSYMGSPDGTILDGFKIPLTEEAAFIHFQESRDRGDRLFVEVLEGKTLEEHYRYFLALPGIKEAFEKRAQEGDRRPDFQIHHLANFSHGNLMFITYEPCPEAHDIFIRFAKVFEQTYTRFLDLQKAEAQAREAQVEVALERIRARALAMQSSTELGEVAKVLRDQMGILGQEDLQASVVHLYSAGSPTFDSWYAFRAGDHIIEGVATFSLENSALAKEFLKLYEDDVTEYTIEVKGEKLKEWLAEIKRNAPKIAAYWGDLPPEKQFYHFSDFSGGALLMVSHENLTAETRMLQKRCASVFELAYKRFLDLEAKERQERELLEEKLRLEHALSELKATQSQLVQQEKLASLGQLTAGIAHEIKNPLNFVNNFSEVSLEMIEEVIEERSKSEETRDETLVDEILEDIKSNLQKVHDHGTRANGIVTSMLQHSRGSSGKMAPSDLNALIKEYVNLCFHGMRANKNPIDVNIQLELEPSLEPISLIKEDFTRVVINLCNNAFDAMRQKTLEGLEGYQPKLNLRTKSEKDSIIIEVSDNGPGIPEDIKDKILQPFFTTKKGTEGTGLGLSITHDIIKAHGGELSVESSLGFGAKFIIKLNK